MRYILQNNIPEPTLQIQIIYIYIYIDFSSHTNTPPIQAHAFIHATLVN